MHTNTVLENNIADALAPSAPKMPRREFLSWMGLLGATALITACANPGSAGTLAGNASSAQEATVAPTQAAVAQPTPTATASTSCVQLCPNSCSYPGSCRLYTDGNGNGRCDRGECL